MKDQKYSFTGKGNLRLEGEELRELTRRLRDVTEERDILKNALANLILHWKKEFFEGALGVFLPEA